MTNKAFSPLENLVSRATELYNRYRSPEATAKLAKTEKDGFTIEFEGPFCQSCGVSEYFNDFIYDLEDVSRNIRAEIKAVEPTGPQTFRVQYAVSGNFSGADVDEEDLFKEFLGTKGLSFEDYLAANNCTKDVMKFHFRTWLLERKPE